MNLFVMIYDSCQYGINNMSLIKSMSNDKCSKRRFCILNKNYKKFLRMLKISKSGKRLNLLVKNLK